MVDYERVMYNGLWTILGYYLTIQRWKLEFKPFEESIKKIAVWIRIPDLPIEYYEKHFLWKAGDKIGKTLKVDVHIIKENQIEGEMNSTERGRFARISVEVNLEKKLVPRIKIRNRTYLIEYEGLNLIFFSCGIYGHHKETCPLTRRSDYNSNMEGDNNSTKNMYPSGKEVDYENQQQEKDTTYGNWMIVKRNTRNRNDYKQQNKRDKGMKLPQSVKTALGDNPQNPKMLRGSRFAAFELDEELTTETEAEHVPRESMEQSLINRTQIRKALRNNRKLQQLPLKYITT